MKWTETITPKQAAEELGVPYHGWMREMDRAWISEDQKYSVMSRLLRTEWGKVEHVTITAAEGVGRSDGSGLMNGIKRRRSSLGVWWWLCTRKRALEPHAWSGPVMRCTSFSSGIGQKS